MNARPGIRPKIVGFILIFILLVIMFCRVFLPDKPPAPAPAPVYSSITNQISQSTKTDFVSISTNYAQSPKLPHSTTLPAPPDEEVSSVHEVLAVAPQPTPVLLGSSSAFSSATFGIVDSTRIFSAFKMEEGSYEARYRFVERIKRIVGNRAAAHHLIYLFDASASTTNGISFIAATNGVPDLTDEIILELAR